MGRAGTYIKQLKGYNAFMPAPLPPKPPLEQDDELTSLVSQAGIAIGKLSGLATIISDVNFFIYLYVRKEALLSSQIEGTQCSLEDVLNPDPENAEHIKDIEEVSNYVKAMNQGLRRLTELPLSTRLIKEIHAILLAGVRGSSKTPGEFRRSQNWIGRPGSTPSTAAFIPPPPEDVERLMGELEKYIHQDDDISPLIKVALIHAQFETIHPFLDGNGRLGRLLVTYLLCTWGVLDKPLLYLSYYLKIHRSEYYAKMMDVRLKGNWEAWVKFFLRGLCESATTANQTALDAYHLQQRDRSKLEQTKILPYAKQVFEEFCRNPILNNATLVKKHNASKPKVQRALDALIKVGMLQETSGKARNRVYAYRAYLDILTRDTATPIG